jgi:Enoyl-(Acyl carrier protein) reductase
VNCIAPGVIATGRIMQTVIPGSSQSNRGRAELVALRRFGTVEDCAKVVEFLATDLSGYVTGAVIPIDGGLVRGVTAVPEKLPPSFSAPNGASPWSKGRNLPRYPRGAKWCTLGVQMGCGRACKTRRIARSWYGEGGIRTLGPSRDGVTDSRGGEGAAG